MRQFQNKESGTSNFDLKYFLRFEKNYSKRKFRILQILIAMGEIEIAMMGGNRGGIDRFVLNSDYFFFRLLTFTKH